MCHPGGDGARDQALGDEWPRRIMDQHQPVIGQFHALSQMAQAEMDRLLPGFPATGQADQHGHVIRQATRRCLCERAVVLSQGGPITADLIAPWLSRSTNGQPRPTASGGVATSPQNSDVRPLAEIEREVIVHTLEHFKGHRQKTAQALGIGVRTLGLKLKKWKEMHLVAQTL